MDGTTEGIVAALITTVGGYVLKTHNARIKKIEDDQSDTEKELSSHKLESEKRYAKEETLQSSLARIHELMEKRFDELRGDIKQLMAKE